MPDQTQPSDKSKLAVTLIVIATASVLRAFGLIESASWTSAVTLVSSAYMLGQVASVVAQGYSVQAVAKAQGVLNGTAKQTSSS